MNGGALITETVMMSAKPVVSEIKARVSSEVKRLKREEGIEPKLVALLIGNDPVSRIYVKLKRVDCAEVGVLV